MANPYEPSSVHESSDIGERHDYRSAQTLSIAVRALLAVTVAVSAISIAHSITQLDLFDRIEHDGAFTLAEAEASDERAVLILGQRSTRVERVAELSQQGARSLHR